MFVTSQKIRVVKTRKRVLPRLYFRVDIFLYRRHEGASLRLRDVGCSRGLATRARMRSGEFSGLFLRDATTKRAAVTLGAHLTLVLHHHVRLVRHAVLKELLQMGWLWGRREIGVENGEAVPSGRYASWCRLDRQVHARGQYAQQQGGQKGELYLRHECVPD